jgi:colanic acid biosynthesis glycosyl transferase WcaI
MKLIFFNRFFAPDQSATSQILSDLACRLATRGAAVHVVASRGLYTDPRAVLPARARIGGVEAHRTGRARFGRGALFGRALDYAALYWRFALAALRLAPRGDCIIVMTDPPLLSVVLAPIARLKGARLVNWLQDLYPEVALGLGAPIPAPLGAGLAQLRDRSLAAADRNVAIGALMRERLIARGLAPAAVTVIHNWSDDVAITPRAAVDSPLRAEWGLQGKFVIGYSGNLGRAHEYRTVLDAAEHLRDVDNLAFLFIGGGGLVDGLKAAVDARGLTRLFHFRPYQDAARLPCSLAVADIHWISLRPEMEGLIVPSKFYGVAAAGRGALAICDPAGEIASLIARGDCGATIAPGDAAGLATRIRALARDPQTLARWGVNARRLLDAEFGRERALRQWESLLADMGSKDI